MASLQQIQSRRRAVKNVGQITKAMEVVATTKMRKTQEVALRSRPYAYKILELLNRISRTAPIETELTRSRSIKTSLILIVSSDRGLIGSFNSQVLRFADEFISNDEYFGKEGHTYKVVTVGKKATGYAKKKGLNIVKSFEGFGDFVTPNEMSELSELLINGYLDSSWDRVITLSMHFRSTLKQEVMRRQVLPIDFGRVIKTLEELVPEYGKYSDSKIQDAKYKIQNLDNNQDTYIFEPSAKEAIESIMPHMVKMQLYHLMIEANASEHSARRVAMKTASDNAKDLSSDLTLEFNKIRQANITREIIEITSTQAI